MSDYKKYNYFPETYCEGKMWFEKLMKAASGRMESHTLPNYEGPFGEVLSTEVAWFGPVEAKKVFVSISGTHGQEYFSGAAGQFQWIDNKEYENLPDDVAVCLVHCNNPYGSAYLSRGNEDFVDLNRNYLDSYENLRANDLVDELNKLVFTKNMNEHCLDDAMANLYEFVEKNDTKKALTAIGGGQNSHPDGNLYCGKEQSWSVKNLKHLIATKLCHAEKVALIDWHTGLGDFGELSVLTEFEDDAYELKIAKSWWGENLGIKGDSSEEQPDFIGHVSHGMADDLRALNVKVIESVVEIGTVDNQSVLAALLIDRWLRKVCQNPNQEHAIKMRTQMIERLNPSLTSWRLKVLEHTKELYKATINGLADW